jgi:hypothetical protein
MSTAGALFTDLSAAVTSSSLALAATAHRALNPLPSITMAFARVDGGKQLLAWNKADAQAVNERVVQVLMMGLRAVRGGYLCRVQEAELKYMVAFYDPQVCVYKLVQSAGSCSWLRSRWCVSWYFAFTQCGACPVR